MANIVIFWAKFDRLLAYFGNPIDSSCEQQQQQQSWIVDPAGMPAGSQSARACMVCGEETNL